MTSQNMKAKDIEEYKCPLCKDTSWILGENGARRCKCYEKERIKRLWKAFGVDPEDVKKVSEYIPYDKLTESARNKAIEYIQNFKDVRGERENSYGLFGQPGSGKTHLVIAIGAALLKENIKVIYMPYLEASRELKANVNDDEYYLKLSDRYKRADLLIIDDLFKDKVRSGQLIKGACITGADMNHIYPILNYRYFNKLPILFSTECTPEILIQLDDALGGRITETCEPYMTIFRDKKYNYRMRKFIKTGA
jgi:DNA replication protein DnaC